MRVPRRQQGKDCLPLSLRLGLVCCWPLSLRLVYFVSLRQQLQDVGKKLVGAQHYNKDGAVNSRLITVRFTVYSMLNLQCLFSAYYLVNDVCSSCHLQISG
ncbi:hypothetical protein Droror1_Dr00024015 [Drosera rotundifolia]